MSEDTMAMTPPLTPPVGGKDEDVMDSDSLDYMDFFVNDMEVSPLKDDRNAKNILTPKEGPIQFCCNGKPRWTQNFSDMSCISRQAVASLLQYKDPCPFALHGEQTSSFFPCTPDNLRYNLNHFFMGLRQGVATLERGSKSNVCTSQNYPSVQYSKIRQDITNFFNCLVSYIHGLFREEDKDFLHQVVAQVLDVLIFMGPLHDLPEHVNSASSAQGNKCPLAAYHLFHLHLDVRWWSLTLFHIIEFTLGTLCAPQSHSAATQHLLYEPKGLQAVDSAEVSDRSPLQQCISMVVWDLITNMCREGMKKSLEDLHQTSGSTCTCSQELGVMVLHFLDHRHSALGKQSFWEQIRHKLLVTLKFHSEAVNPPICPTSETSSQSPQSFRVLQYPPAIIKNAKLPHVWWLFINFAKFYGYDVDGKIIAAKSMEIKSETKLLRMLIKLSLSEQLGGPQPTGSELRFYLRCCLTLMQLWGSSRSSEWAVPLWDYFSKHLDSSYLLPGAGLDGLACISKTANGWLEQVKSRVPDAEFIPNSETSWQMFLRVVVGVVRSSSSEWRQLRGRIYSKFHGRKMSELSPMGLYNSTSLFLTLANTTDMVDVSNKLGELLSMAPTVTISRTRIIWRGFLVTALMLVTSGCNISPIVQKISSKVTTACHDYGASRDAMQRRDLGQLITAYADGVQEIFEQSTDMTLSQHTLFCSGFGSYLQHCSSTEMKSVLNAVGSALSKVHSISAKSQSLTSGMGLEVVEAIWKEFGGFIKSHATTSTPPVVLSSVASLLTCCLARDISSSSSGLREAALGLFSFYVSNGAVNPVCSLQYVSTLLRDYGNSTLMSRICPTYEGLIVSSWLSTLIVMGATEEVVALTPMVISLPGVSTVILLQNVHDCPFSAASALVCGVTKLFQEAENFATRMAHRETALQYFSGLDKPLGTLLKKVPAPGHLSLALDLVTSLFYYAHSLIYIKSRPTCPLPSLVSTVLLPTAVYSPEKPLTSTLSSSLATNIPKMVSGLASLGVGQDPYLLRCVRDIFTHYVYRFPVKTTVNYSTTLHPFIICLHDGELKEEVLLELHSVFLEVVRDSYICRRGANNMHLQLVFLLLIELLSRSPTQWLQSLCSVLLFPVLELLLTIEEPLTKRAATDFLQKLLQEVQDQDVPPRTELVRVIQKFAVHHVSWSSTKLFRVLGVVGVLHRTLLVDALPYITQAVTATEEKRGTGLDHTLRQGYQSLLASLGVNEDDGQIPST